VRSSPRWAAVIAAAERPVIAAAERPAPARE